MILKSLNHKLQRQLKKLSTGCPIILKENSFLLKKVYNFCLKTKKKKKIFFKEKILLNLF